MVTRTVVICLSVFLAGCATLGVGDKFKNAGVFCGTEVGMGVTIRGGFANLDKGAVLDGGRVECTPDGALRIESGTTPPKVPKEPKEPPK